MKTLVGSFLIAACFIACAQSYPGLPRILFDSDESDEKSVGPAISVPSLMSRNLGRPIAFPALPNFDDDSDESDSSIFRTNAFMDAWMNSVQDLMRRLKEQLASILSPIPDTMIKIPEGANTTSTTKVIDGHVITINDTTYEDAGDDVHVMFRVRVIDVKPQNDTLLVTSTEKETNAEATTLPNVAGKESTTSPSRSVETVEDVDNTIPKNEVDTLTA